MKISDFNWRLIILSAVGTAIIVNAVIMLLAILLFSGGIFSDTQIAPIMSYLVMFAIFSPCVAPFISTGIVTFFSTQRKLLHTVFLTIITFILTALILITVTAYVSDQFFIKYDRRINRCEYEECGE